MQPNFNEILNNHIISVINKMLILNVKNLLHFNKLSEHLYDIHKIKPLWRLDENLLFIFMFRSALKYSIIRRYTNIVYYHYIPQGPA